MVVSPEYNSREKLKVAVLEFDYKAKANQTSIFWAGASLEDAGKITADALAEQLLKIPCFTVVERSRLKAILEERKLSEVGLLQSQQLGEISGLAGIDAIVTGSVGEASGGNAVGVQTSQVAFTARCIRARDGVVLWSASTSAQTPSQNVSRNLHNAMQELGLEIQRKCMQVNVK